MADRSLNVLLVASEVTGFAKTGGLADVVASLPQALARRGHTMAVAMPLHRTVRYSGQPLTPTDHRCRIPIGTSHYHARLWRSHLPNSDVPVYLIEQPEFFDRDDGHHGRGLYQYQNYGGPKRDYDDNGQRFLFFSRAVLEFMPVMDAWPDVVHCNDWQTGLIPAYIKELYGHHDGRYQGVRTLLTIHNLAYQGAFPPLLMATTGLSAELFHMHGLEFYGQLNFLKAGLTYADLLNTVSPRYAEEICTSAYGYGLEELLRTRRGQLSGIVNGVDYREWDPRTDKHIPSHYDAEHIGPGKPQCKSALQRRFGLPDSPHTPLLGVVARLADQKGIDLLLAVADPILRQGVQLVVVGEGDPHLHHHLGALRDYFSDRMGLHLGFNEPLAHLVEAGADMFLMPSKFEPSGLNQLYSLRYGTVPVVRAVGGLADTVVDFEDATRDNGTATGFHFVPYTAGAFQYAIERAVGLYRHHPDLWGRVMRTGMLQDWSWDRSAGEYERLYRRLVG